MSWNVPILILLLNCLYYFCQPLSPSHETPSDVSGDVPKCTTNDEIPHGYGALDSLFGTTLRLKRAPTGTEQQRGLRKRGKKQDLAKEARDQEARDPAVTTLNTQPNKLPTANTDSIDKKRVDAIQPRVQTEPAPIVEAARRRKEPSKPAEPVRKPQTQVPTKRPTLPSEKPPSSKLAESNGQPTTKVARVPARQVEPTGMSRSRYTVNAGQKVSSTPMKPEEKQQPQTPRSRESSKRPEERRTPPMPDGSKTLRRREQSVATVNVQIQNAQSGTIDNRANTVRGLTHSSGSRQVIPPKRFQNGASKGPLQIQNELLAKAQLPPQHRFTTLRRSDPTENLRNKFKMHATAIDLPRTRHSSGGTSSVNDYKRVEEYYKSKDGKVTVWIVKDKDGRYFIRKDMTYDPVNKLDNECVHEVNVFHRLHSDPTPSRFIVRAYAWDTRPTKDKRVRIVMEKHPGLHLNNYIIESKGLPESKARFIIKQIILGVNYLHSHGIIWRDLKGDNILMVASENGGIDGTIVLSDFEYAHLCQPKDANSCTNTDFAGSDPYMAPEIVENLAVYEKWQTTGEPGPLKEHSYAVDWWSLGVVLHFMIYFSVPFDGLFPYTKENIHLYKPRFPKNINVSKQLAGEDFAGKSMLQLLLEADPEKRSNGCKDLLNHPWLKNVSDIEKDVLEDLEQPRPNLRLLKKFAKWSGQQKSAFRKALEERQHKEALADLNNQIDDLLGDFNQDFNQDVIESTEQPEFDTLESDIMKKLNAIPTLKPTKRPVRLPKIVPLEQT